VSTEVEEEPPPVEKRKGSSAFWTVVKLLVALGLMAYLWRSGAIDFAAVGTALTNPAWFVPALLTAFASMAIITIRWWLLLRLEKIELPLADALKLTLVGQFWNNVLPGAVTGDFVKMYYIGRKSPDKKAEAYATVMIDRVVGLAALIYVGFFAAMTNREFVLAPDHEKLRLTFYGNTILAVGFTVGILALVLGVGRQSFFAEKLRGSSLPAIEGIRRGYRTLIRLGERPSILFASFALGMLSHALLVVIGIVSARALGETSLGLPTQGFVIPIGLLVNSIPIGLPGGLGAGEKAFQELYIWAGAAATLGANVMLLLRIAQLGWGLVGGVIYIFDRKALAPALEPTAEVQGP
jgi:uncharacterized membrane protein YbhN (UPF0104 family)